MSKIDNEELDRLIEEAVFENGARKQLRALEQEIRREEQRRRKRKRIGWIVGAVSSVAAAAVVAVAVSVPSEEQIQRGIELSREYISVDETYRAPNQSDTDRRIEAAVEKMKEGHVEEALASLSEIRKSLDDERNDDFIDARTLEYTKRTVDWYMALAYLNQGNVSKARPLLKKVGKSGSYYADDAGRLLKEIKDYKSRNTNGAQ